MLPPLQSRRWRRLPLGNHDGRRISCCHGFRFCRRFGAAAMLRALSAIALLALLLAGCDDESERAAPPDNGGDAERGAALIRHYGCGGCHIVPGISGANGLVGPPLTLMARRIYIAGVLRNSP